MNKPFRKVAFSAFIVVVCTIMISIGSVIALDAYSMTVTTDQISYAQGAIVTISGILTNTNTSSPVSDAYIGIKVYDSIGEVAYSTIAVTALNGSYSSYFSSQLETEQPIGNYTILVTAAINGSLIASKTTTYLVTLSSPTPTPTPTPTATPSPSPTLVPTATPTPVPTPTLTPNPTLNPSPTTKPTASPSTSPTANPTATSTPQPTPTPTIPEFPVTVLVLVAFLAASAIVVLGLMKRNK